MKLTRYQLKRMVENYLFEKDEKEKENENEKVSKNITFKVSVDNRDVDINFIKDKDTKLHKIYIDGKLRKDIDDNLKLNKITAHGFIHPDTSGQTKDLLMKILSNDPDFAGKSKDGITAMIKRKIEDVKGVQSYGHSYLSDIVGKG